MMKIEFTNRFGTAVFSGGRRFGYDTCYLLAVSGLGLAPRRMTTTVYSGQDGAKTEDVTFSQRKIILTADVPRRRADFETFYAQLLRILSGEVGVMFVSSKKKKRRIVAMATQVSEGESRADCKKIVVTFTCDDPYFTGEEPVEADVLTIKKNLKTSFTFPVAEAPGNRIVFSERIYKATVRNGGDVDAEPVIVFENGVGGAFSAEGYLQLKNTTTGKSIKLLTYPEQGKSITVDIANRTVTSSDGDDLIGTLSDDSDLSEFFLPVGENEIEADSNVENQRARVTCRFYDRFYEGVVYGY